MGENSVKCVENPYIMNLKTLAKLVNSSTMISEKRGSLSDATLNRMMANTKSELMKNKELKEECKHFAAWLRNEYIFPVRVPIYFKNYVKLRCIDGATASAAFFRPDSYFDEPYIRIAVGDYRELCEDWGEIEALFAVLRDIAHELTHYFQWINRLELTAVGEERQATNYSRRIVNDEYQDVWESEHIEKVEDWYRSHNVNDDR